MEWTLSVYKGHPCSALIIDLNQRFSKVGLPGGLQTVSGEAQRMEVKKYYISYYTSYQRRSHRIA